MKTSRPYDPSRYTTVPEVLALAAQLEDRIAELEAALDRIRRIKTDGFTKSAAECFYECVGIADAALTKPERQ